jgi:hypothetical protein
MCRHEDVRRLLAALDVSVVCRSLPSAQRAPPVSSTFLTASLLESWTRPTLSASGNAITVSTSRSSRPAGQGKSAQRRGRAARSGYESSRGGREPSTLGPSPPPSEIRADLFLRRSHPALTVPWRTIHALNEDSLPGSGPLESVLPPALRRCLSSADGGCRQGRRPQSDARLAQRSAARRCTSERARRGPRRGPRAGSPRRGAALPCTTAL